MGSPEPCAKCGKPVVVTEEMRRAAKEPHKGFLCDLCVKDLIRSSAELRMVRK